MRLGIDTNILVRALFDDGSSEVAWVNTLMRENQIVISPTVLLETEWVLRDAYELGRNDVAKALEGLLGTTSVTILQRDAVVRAFGAFRDGCDFADAFHAAFTPGVEAFMTLDRKFARRAETLGIEPPVRLLSTAS